MRATLVVALGLAAAACGQDYRGPELATTGLPAGPVGQAFDVAVDLGALHVIGATLPGLDLDVRIELERAGAGEIPARVSFEGAHVPLGTASVHDLSDGRTTVLVGSERWTTGRLGPLQVEGSLFELVLDGAHEDGGWAVAGRAWESQGATTGSFSGRRRHRFLLAGTDFFSVAGRLGEVALVAEQEVRVRGNLEPLSADPVLRATGGAVYAVNRLSFDNLQRLDPFDDYATSWQRSVGGGANPQDVLAVGPDRAYVSRYERPFDDLAIVDTSSGKITGHIPLGPWAANPDATPRATALRMAAGAVFVALQDIDRTFTRYAEGKLAVVDPALDAVVGIIPLGGKNPFDLDLTRDAQGRETLWVALAGIFPGLLPQELSGGVVAVDPVARVVVRLALDDDDAGGNVGRIAMASERLGYAVVTDASFVNRVLAFDPATGTVRRTVLASEAYVADLALDSRGVLAIAVASFTDPTLCLYRTPADPAVPETRIHCNAVELPPLSIEALD